LQHVTHLLATSMRYLSLSVIACMLLSYADVHKTHDEQVK